MLEKIKNKILRIKEIVGIEVSFLQDGSLSVNAVQMAVRNNILFKTNEWFNVNLPELHNKLLRPIPVVVVVTGKNVLVKSIPFRPNITNYVHEILPESNPNDFYFTFLKQQENIFIAAARKEVVNKLIDELITLKFIVLDVSLSFFDLSILLPFLTANTTNLVTTSTYSVRFNEYYAMTSYDYTPLVPLPPSAQPEYVLAGQYLRASIVLAFATASKLIAENLKTATPIPSSELLFMRKEFRFSKYFAAAVWTVLIGIFSLLTANFLIYNYFFNRNKEMTALETISLEQITHLKKQSAELQRKEIFLSSMGWVKISRTSYFADRIASLLTPEVFLTSLNIYPQNNATGNGQGQAVFKKDTIQITGNCIEPAELSQFTNNLKNLVEFREVAIRNYLYKKENDNASFLIEIIIR